MENIYHIHEKKLMKILIPIVLIVIIMILLFANFCEQYGVIPFDYNLTVGDTVAKVVTIHGIPDSASIEKESNTLYLDYNNKNIFDIDTVVVYSFTNNSLYGIDYYGQINDFDKESIISKIKDEISSALNSDYEYSENNSKDKKISNWSYSTGARYETIELICDVSQQTIEISILFQY